MGSGERERGWQTDIEKGGMGRGEAETDKQRQTKADRDTERQRQRAEWEWLRHTDRQTETERKAVWEEKTGSQPQIHRTTSKVHQNLHIHEGGCLTKEETGK